MTISADFIKIYKNKQEIITIQKDFLNLRPYYYIDT